MSQLRAAARARFTLGRLALAAVLVAISLGTLALIERDHESGAPEDHAARLVPASALAYLHATVDRDSAQWRNAGRIAARIPRLVALRNRLLRSVTLRGGKIDLDREVYPWLGDEAALAFLRGERNVARSLILLEVTDKELARAFLSRAVGRPARTAYRGTAIDIHGSLATAFVGKFLAIGQLENVRTAIGVERGAIASLEQSVPFTKARDGLPDEDRLLYAYASREGVKRLLRRRPGLIGRLARLADDPRLAGAAASLDAEARGARVHFASTLGPQTAVLEKRKETRFASRLASAVPQDAVAYIDMRGADQLIESIRALVGSSSLTLPPLLGRVRSELSGRRGLPIRRALRPLLSREAALFVTPSSGAPVLTLILDNVRRDEAAMLLERLQPLLVRLLERPTAGQVPTFRPLRIAGVDAASLRISPAVELTYSVFGGRAVVSTSPKGIAEVRSSRLPITQNPLFDQEIRNHLRNVTSVLFLDLEQLLALGERAGLGETRGYRQLRADLSQVSAVSAFTSGRDTSRRASIFIEVK